MTLAVSVSLPLMRKTFIEARINHWWHPRRGSLPLMRKTFIEATATPLACRPQRTSLPLMRKTFIEGRVSVNLSQALVFCCLYSRLSFVMK